MAATSKPRLRPLAMRAHRWMALALGAWFFLVGLTGSVLVWHAELDRALNPEWFAPRASCGAMATPIVTSLAVFAREVPNATATQVMAPLLPGAAYTVWQKPGPDGRRIQHFIDASCGRHLGQRIWGAPGVDRKHLVPALYELHRSLLSGEIGHLAVGIAGLVLLSVAITGALIAWPRHAAATDWKRVVTIKRGAAAHRRYYDLHRATGMWLLVFLLPMGVTGAYLCFPKQGRALVAYLLPTKPLSMQSADTPDMHRDVDPDALVRHAERLWPAAVWTRIQLPTHGSGAYDVRLLQQEELRMDTGDTRVRISSSNRLIDVRDPLRAPPGDTVLSWLFPFHSGEAFGLPGRVTWTLFGLAPPLLFVTGLWLWWKRRKQMGSKTSRHAH